MGFSLSPREVSPEYVFSQGWIPHPRLTPRRVIRKHLCSTPVDGAVHPLPDPAQELELRDIPPHGPLPVVWNALWCWSLDKYTESKKRDRTFEQKKAKAPVPPPSCRLWKEANRHNQTMRQSIKKKKVETLVCPPSPPPCCWGCWCGRGRNGWLENIGPRFSRSRWYVGFLLMDGLWISHEAKDREIWVGTDLNTAGGRLHDGAGKVKLLRKRKSRTPKQPRLGECISGI